jgi:hypothetical protein
MIALWRRMRLRGWVAVLPWSLWWALLWLSAFAEDSDAFGYVLLVGLPVTALVAQARAAIAGFLGAFGVFVLALSAGGGPLWPLGVLAGLALLAIAVLAQAGAGRLFARLRARRAGSDAA